jgi:hypothetical protein
MMKRILAAVVLGAAVFTAACSDPTAPATPTPVVPVTAEVFSDTLLVQGANTHSFTVTDIGGLKVSLTSLQPGAAVGLGVGTYGVGSCTIIDHISAVAGASIQLSGTVTVPGTYCVEVFDLGNLVESVAYTINVLHS